MKYTKDNIIGKRFIHQEVGIYTVIDADNVGKITIQLETLHASSVSISMSSLLIWLEDGTWKSLNEEEELYEIY